MDLGEGKFLQSLLAAARFVPRSLTYSSAWVGHVTFAAWLIRELRPETFVELGTFSGNSYFAFCQSALEANMPVKCYAVDTWEGDEHGGFYGQEIYDYVVEHNERHYRHFSRLLRMRFSAALDCFSAGSIDFLHLDGLHTYAAVKDDFDSWLPKLSERGVVLLHDINVRERGFGVWKLWEELRDRFPLHLEFPHSNGLGVVKVGQGGENPLWLRPHSATQKFLLDFFCITGMQRLQLFELAEWEKEAAENRTRISLLQKSVDEQAANRSLLSASIEDLNTSLGKKEEHIRHLNAIIAEKNGTIKTLSNETAELRERTDQIVNSKSWRLTQPLRVFRQSFRTFSLPMSHAFFRTRNAARYIARGDFRGLQSRWKALQAERSLRNVQLGPGRLTFCVMATKHTLFIAHLLAERLQAHGYRAEVAIEYPRKDLFDFYFVICPQMFGKLPSGEKRIVLQMEQSVTTRWFTGDYIGLLESSLCVIDYSLCNIEFLEKKGIAYPHVHYLPVGASGNYGKAIPAAGKDCDVLFYGDSQSSPRRRKMLDALRAHFDVRVVDEVFGNEMQQAIRRARLVLNLHYYEGALLEMPRIQECLSLGTPVVSEASRDQDEYPELGGAVRFFAAGSITAMITAIREALARPVTAEAIASSVAASARRFAFMFDRFLLAAGFLPAAQACYLTLPLPDAAEKIVLSLPETVSRRRIFDLKRVNGYVLFDGLRRRPGWIGCGLSYAALARHALRQGKTRLTVMEDDVLLPDDFDGKIAIIYEYLDARAGDWDVFSGLIAYMPAEARILSAETYKGILFATIDRMTSMVFNIYSKSIMELLTVWDPDNMDPETNTIDKYLEKQSHLRVVITFPFLVGHREDVNSTLWGFNNMQYSKMIGDSEFELKRMISHHMASQKAAACE